MATKPENQFRSGVHKHLPDTLHHEKMNNPYSSGTADDYYSGFKADLWVEYKYIPRIPQRGSVVAALSTLQKKWINGRHREGRNVAVIIGCPTGGIILRDEEWEAKIPAKEFVSRTVSRADLALWIRNQVEE